MNTPTLSLGDALLGRTRGKILALLLGCPDEEFHVRHVARLTGGAVGPVQKELKRLAHLGVLESRVAGHQLFYTVNPQCPLRVELTGLATKTFGAHALVRAGMERLGPRVNVAFIFGSTARGTQGRESDIDLMVIGRVKFAEVVAALREAQLSLGRDINPIVYSPDEFADKLHRSNHFVTSVMAGEKWFVVGDADELRRVAEKRLGQASPEQPAGSRGASGGNRARSRNK